MGTLIFYLLTIIGGICGGFVVGSAFSYHPLFGAFLGAVISFILCFFHYISSESWNADARSLLDVKD